MSFMKRNANLLLLGLIVIASIGIVGATLYFQNTFENINAEYNTKIDDLKKARQELEKQEQVLQQIQAELQLKEARESNFTAVYTEIKQEKENLTLSVDQLEELSERLKISEAQAKEEARKAESDKIHAENLKKEAETDLALKQQELTKCNLNIKSLADTINSLQNSVRTYETRLANCKNTCGTTCDST